ncbi:MAG: SGNH/GDSL hydrolase family protein [Ilumatobacteraceae bacterium]
MLNSGRRIGSFGVAIGLAITATVWPAGHLGAYAGQHRLAAVTPVGTAAKFQSVAPTRLADTRQPACGCTRLDEHTIRVVVAGRGPIATGISSAAITITAAGASAPGFVTIFPAGQERPDTSVLNLPVGAATSNSTIIPIGTDGAVDLYTSVSASLIVDITGTFTPAATAADGRFQPMSPTRVLDTRSAGPVGLKAGGSVTVPLPPGVDAGALAVAVNVTSVGAGAGFLTGYAAGSEPPSTSFMNPDGSGSPRAASVILPTSPTGFTIASSSGGHVIVDVVGWFTGTGAATSADGLLMAVAPTRLLDTRISAPRVWPGGTREVPLPVPAAVALVTNLTMVGPDSPGFVAAYPAGVTRPSTSSVNAPGRNATTPNFAITVPSSRGTAYYASGGTDLLVDLTGYFTGAPVAATLAPPPNPAPIPRVLMVGDSTLGGLFEIPRTRGALRGFEYVLDTKPCRRLVRASCVSAFTHYAPNTAQNAIDTAAGSFDVVVIKTGYNDAAADFEAAIPVIMDAARAKGAKVVVWFTYSEGKSPGAYNTQNATLKRLAGSTAFPDLVVADWRTYAANTSGWYAADRVHLATAGVWATADYISRWVANTNHLVCPMPWTVGGSRPDPCPSPDDTFVQTGAPPGLQALYGT